MRIHKLKTILISLLLGLIIGSTVCFYFPSLRITYKESIPGENYSMKLLWLGGKFTYIPVYTDNKELP